jgi:hypothetical protein
MKIADACNRFRLEQPQQLHDMQMSLNRDVLAEVNQQRLVARRLESHVSHTRAIPHPSFLATTAYPES